MDQVMGSGCLTPLDAVFFDCDGTLSQIEGINYLAALNDQSDEVDRLTEIAMSKKGLSLALYEARLSLVRPTVAQMQQLADAYFNYRTHDLDAVIRVLQGLGKAVYIISAGNNPAVTQFAERLGVSSTHVITVDLQFDEAGEYVDFDRQSPLVTQEGKGIIMTALRYQHHYHQIALVGDGMNDVSALDVVDHFVGYGHHYYREQVARLCEHYVQAPSMFAVLTLLLTADEHAALKDPQHPCYLAAKGLFDLH